MNIASIVLSQVSDKATIHHLRRNGVARVSSINELRQRVINLSAQLSGAGVGYGDNVLIIASNRIEAVEALLAVCNIGATAVPLSPQVSLASQVHIVENIRPKAVISDTILDPVVAGTMAKTCNVWISIGDALRSSEVQSLEFAALASTHVDGELDREHDPSHPAIIVFTSGSTGAPKGVVRSHRVMDIYVSSIPRHYSAQRLEVIRSMPQIVPLPLCHFSGLGPCLTALFVGRPVYILGSFDPLQYLRLLSSTRSESLILIPSMYSLLLRHRDQIAGLDLSAIKYCYHVAEASSDALADEVARTFGAMSISAYGMTECLSGIGYRPDELEAGSIKPGSCGKHLFGELKLVDSDGQEQPDMGELWVRNQTVEPCYTNSQLNQQRFSDGWFKTGDVFSRDSEGYLYWRGRCDDMFVCKGNNIYPAELEAAMAAHPSVSAVCVSPIVDRHGMTMPAAAVVTKEECSSQMLMEFLAARVSSRAMPVLIQLIQDLPMVGPGKLDRRGVARLLQQHYDRRA